MKLLKEDLKTGRFKRMYLLFGEERYLVEHYSDAIAAQLLADADPLMNRDNLGGKDIPVERILYAAETLPFLAERRLVYVRGSQLFTAGRKQDTEALADYLADVPETTVLVFIESDVDKRSRLYKKTAELGRAVECKPPSEGELITWVGNIFKKKGKLIGKENAQKLLRTVMHNMKAVYTEADKLGHYVGERAEITAEDINAVCSPSLEARIFDLVAAVGEGRAGDALARYHILLQLKESPIVILSMVARQFRLILQCKCAGLQKKSASVIAGELGLRGFVVDECLKQGRRFSVERLLDALRDCGDTDVRMKSGLVNAETGLELLIVRYSH